MCNHHSDITKQRLDEALLRELKYRDFYNDVEKNLPFGAETDKLPVRDYLAGLKSVEFVEMREDTMKFFVTNERLNGWSTYVKLDEWYDLLYDYSLTATECARLAIWVGNLKLHCNCPSYRFHGYNYILTQLDSAIYDENRFPKKTNSSLKGFGCKHLRKTLLHLGFNNQMIAKAIKEQRRELLHQS